MEGFIQQIKDIQKEQDKTRLENIELDNDAALEELKAKIIESQEKGKHILNIDKNDSRLRNASKKLPLYFTVIIGDDNDDTNIYWNNK